MLMSSSDMGRPRPPSDMPEACVRKPSCRTPYEEHLDHVSAELAKRLGNGMRADKYLCGDAASQAQN